MKFAIKEMFKRQFYCLRNSSKSGLGLNSEAYRDLRTPQARGVFFVTMNDHENSRMTTNDHK